MGWRETEALSDETDGEDGELWIARGEMGEKKPRMKTREWAGDERQKERALLFVGGQWWTACVTGRDKK